MKLIKAYWVPSWLENKIGNAILIGKVEINNSKNLTQLYLTIEDDKTYAHYPKEKEIYLLKQVLWKRKKIKSNRGLFPNTELKLIERRSYRDIKNDLFLAEL